MSDKTAGRLSTYTYPTELAADGIRLRLPTLDDVDAIAPAFVDPAVGGEAGLPPFGADALRFFIENQLEDFRSRGLMSPYLIEDAETGELLGGAALHHFDPMRDVIELGYWLFVPARGRGVATRAVESMVAHAFAGGVYRVEAHVRVGNDASERVLERAGFTREGVRRGVLRHEGRRVDATLFSKLVDE
jgi:RimJ/RimL family protein N-acetyltransferase